MSWIRIRNPGVKTGSGSREILKPDPDPSEITRSDRIRIRNPADITLLSLSFSGLERLTRFPALRLEYLYLYKDAPDTIELSLFPTPFLIYRHRTTHIQRAQKIFSSVQKFSELRQLINVLVHTYSISKAHKNYK